MVQKSQAAANVENPIHIMPTSYLSTEINKTGSWRYLRPRYAEKTAPCSAACPAGEDIGKIEMLTAQGLFKEAWETILRENPFPGVCGRVCFHPCESVCNRSEFDDPIAIHTVERFLADTAERNDLKPLLERLPSRPEKVAIVGAGPSGLAAAWFLSRLGYSCDVFEAASRGRWNPSLGDSPLPAPIACPAEGNRPDRGAGCPDPHGKTCHDRSFDRFKVGIPGRLPCLRAWADNGVACPR